MGKYDPAIHSKLKLGVAKLESSPAKPILPGMPVGAQIHRMGLSMHFRMEGGMYVTVPARGPFGSIFPVPTSKAAGKAFSAAIQSVGFEETYSGSGTQYHGPLPIVPDADGKGGEVRVGDTLICRFIVDPETTLYSSDEPAADQIPDTDDDAVDGEGEED